MAEYLTPGQRRWIKSLARSNGYHSVYIIECEREGPIKIGIATDPRKRFETIQCCNFFGLNLARHWWLAGKPIAQRIEAAFKERFSDLKIRGEWFDMTLDEATQGVLDEIVRLEMWCATDRVLLKFTGASDEAIDRAIEEHLHPGRNVLTEV